MLYVGRLHILNADWCGCCGAVFTLTLVQCAPLSCFDFEAAQSMALICFFVMAFDCTESVEQDSVSSSSAQNHAAHTEFVGVYLVFDLQCSFVVITAHGSVYV